MSEREIEQKTNGCQRTVARWMLNDEAHTVSCQTVSSPLVDCAGETDAVVQAGFSRGAMVTYVQSFSCPYRRTETVVVGTRGTGRPVALHEGAPA